MLALDEGDEDEYDDDDDELLTPLEVMQLYLEQFLKDCENNLDYLLLKIGTDVQEHGNFICITQRIIYQNE